MRPVSCAQPIALTIVLALIRPAIAQAPPLAPEATNDAAPIADPSPDEPADQAKPREAPAGVILPQLLEAPQVPYPEEAARTEGVVGLLLTIDSEGRVVDAEVIQPLEPNLDEAARAAARTFRFSPARRDGQPVAVKIRHDHTWTLPPPSSPAPSAPLAKAMATPPKAGAASVQETLEVKVRGKSEAQRLRESSRAVQVIEVQEAKRESADLGEVLARAQGVGVRRGGGLGSGTRFALNGLTDDQVRFFLDGVPLDLAGYPFGIANVPVNLIERVEVYRGVVPIRFGADALGGAVNLVTEQDPRGTRANVSYQEGSFGTRRIALGGHHLHAKSGLFARATSFYDTSDNNYPVNVEVPDPQGRQVPGRAYRFHDGYQAMGANLEAGVVKRPWADRLLLRVFGSTFDRELQNNPTMEIAYGDVTFGRDTGGATLHYQHRFNPRLNVDFIGGYTRTRSVFLDVGTCLYNWFGQCVRTRQKAGEIEEGYPRNDTLYENTAYGRLTVDLNVRPGHVIRLSSAPTYLTRHGDDPLRVVGTVTPNRRLSTLVSGVEYQATFWNDRFENILFGKHYMQAGWSRQHTIATAERELDSHVSRFGAGDSLRIRFVPWLYGKASYEYATRLPRADEVFGDGRLINENLGLQPEVSHNANLGLTLDARRTRAGALRADLNLFLRDADNLIVLQGAYGQRFRNENVFAARSQGVEASAGWTSPREWLSLNANATYLDFRNLSNTGLFARFKGNRIPNRPYLFANASAQLQTPEVFAIGDRLSLTWHTRFVNAFFEFWEGAGTRDSKRTIPNQLIHTAVLTYQVRKEARVFSFAGEVYNLTDEAVYDFFGAQRPGRTVFFKTTAQF